MKSQLRCSLHRVTISKVNCDWCISIVLARTYFLDCPLLHHFPFVALLTEVVNNSTVDFVDVIS